MCVLRVGSLGLLLSCTSVQSAASLSAVETLQVLQHELAGAIVRGDTAALARFYAPEYRFINGLGQLRTRGDVLRAQATEDVQTLALRYEDLEVRVFGSTGVVTGRAMVTTVDRGQRYEGQSRFTRVHLYRKGRWRVVLYQVTRIAGPAGPTYVATATLTPASAPPDAQPASAEQQIRSLEYQRRDAILRNDTATLDRLLASTLTTVTAAGGIVAKSDELAVNRNADREVLAWDFEELDVRVYGDAAVSTIRARFTDVLRGQERREHQRLTHIWVKIAGRWQLVARHATRIAQQR